MPSAPTAIYHVRQASFGGGEVAPSFFGRTDIAKFDISLRKCRNWIVGPQGSLFNRPGTQFIQATKTTGAKVRLIPFQFSDGQAYVLEFGNLYARFFKDGAPVMNPAVSVGGAYNNGSTYVKYQTVDLSGYIFVAKAQTVGNAPIVGQNTDWWWCLGPLSGQVEIPTPYVTADLDRLKFAQSGDVITFASQNHIPFSLSRRGGIVGITFVGSGVFWGFDKILFGSTRVSTDASMIVFHHTNEVLTYAQLTTVAADGYLGFLSPLNGAPGPAVALQENMKIWGYAITVVVDGVEYMAMYTNEVYMLPAAAKSNYTSTTVTRGQPVTLNFNVSWAAANLRVDQFRIYKGRGGRSGTFGLIDILDGDYMGTTAGVRTWTDDGSLTVDFTIPPPEGMGFPGSNCEGLASISLASGGRGIAKGDWKEYQGNVYEAMTSGLEYGPSPTHESGEWWSINPTTGPWYRHERAVWAVGEYMISNGTLFICTVPGTILQTAMTTYTGPVGISTGADGGATFAYASKFYGLVRWKWIGKTENIIIGFPGVVAYANQRLLFANSPNAPAHIWGSAVGDYNNFFDYHLPPQANDPYDFDLAYNTYEEIRGLLPSPKALLGLTSNVEWALGTASGEPISGVSIDARPNSQRGCEWLDPKLIGNVGVYVQSRLPRVREIGFNFDSASFNGADLSVLATHLFDGFTFRDWANAKVPIPIIWMVRSDGKLVAATYVREQEFVAWHWHDTYEGTDLFEQVCVISEADPFAPGAFTDSVYVVVKRGDARYIERFMPRFVPRLPNGTYDTITGVFCDSAKIFTGTAMTVFTGLDHLDGRPVTVLADGNVYGPYTVAGGSIDISDACPDGADYVVVGLRLDSDIEFLPAKVEAGSPQSKRSHVKMTNRISFEVADSRGETWFGPNYTHLRAWRQRDVLDAYGIPMAFTGLGHVILGGSSFEHDGVLCVRQTDPLPCNLLAIEREIDVGGD